MKDPEKSAVLGGGSGLDAAKRLYIAMMIRVGSIGWMLAGGVLILHQFDSLSLGRWESVVAALVIVVPGVAGLLVSYLLETDSGH